MFRLPVADGIELALLEPRHVDLLAGLIDRERGHLSEFLPWAAGQTKDDTRRFVERSLQKFAAGDGFEAGVLVGGELGGMLGLHYLDRAVGSTELGYWLARGLRGQGVMTRAIGGLLPLLYEGYGLNRVEIRCHPDNLKSRRVAERLGFRYEGTLRAVHAGAAGHPTDAMVFGMLRAEWRAGENGATATGGSTDPALEDQERIT